jgi:hypothetical protein
VVEDLDRWPLEHGSDTVGDFPEQHDARHGDVVGRDAAEPGQHLVGADELSAVQSPGEGDKQLGRLVLVAFRGNSPDAAGRYASAQTPSSFPLGSVKWNRRPPGNSYGPFTTWPPAFFTASTDRFRSVE